MRLHTALEHIRNRSCRTMEPWKRGELEEMVRFLQHRADDTIEFTFDYVDPDDTGNTLETFISFANEMWDATIAPIPHAFFWVSWTQKVLDQSVKMAAFCERVHSPTDGNVIGLTVRVVFENHRGNGFAFINQVGQLVIGDHKNVIMNYADNDSSALLVENGFALVKALLGALATPRPSGARKKPRRSSLKHGRRRARNPSATSSSSTCEPANRRPPSAEATERGPCDHTGAEDTSGVSLTDV